MVRLFIFMKCNTYNRMYVFSWLLLDMYLIQVAIEKKIFIKRSNC